MFPQKKKPKQPNRRPSNQGTVSMVTAKGETLEFEDIAGIQYKGKFYAILQPVVLLEGMADDEALVFEVTRNAQGQDQFTLESDDAIVDAVFAEYGRLWRNAHEI